MGCGTHRRSHSRSCHRESGPGRRGGCCARALQDRRVPSSRGTPCSGLHGRSAQSSARAPALARQRDRSWGQSRHRHLPRRDAGSPRKGVERETELVRWPSPRAPQSSGTRAPGCPCPLTAGFVPRELGTSGAQGDSEEPPQNRGLCHRLERAKMTGNPQAEPPECRCPQLLPPHPCPGWASPWLPGAPSSSCACRGKQP